MYGRGVEWYVEVWGVVRGERMCRGVCGVGVWVGGGGRVWRRCMEWCVEVVYGVVYRES